MLSTRTGALVSAAAMLLGVQPAFAAGSLRSADIRVRFDGALACQVVADFDVEAANTTGITHRLVAPDGVVVGDVSITGNATLAAAPSLVGQTRVLTANLDDGRAGTHAYRLTYAIRRERDARTFTCPIWLPDAPTSGSGRPVSVLVELPADATPLPDSFPGFVWSSTQGTSALANVPAFVRVPFSTPTAPASWLDRMGIRRLTDVAVVALVVGASAWRLVTLRRRRNASVA